MKKSLEIFGWYGVVAMLIAYGLISFSLVESTNIWYQFLNLTGALGIGTASLIKKAYQPLIVNIIWSFIAIIAIFKILF